MRDELYEEKTKKFLERAVKALSYEEKLYEALELALPCLIELGDYVGNGKITQEAPDGERCRAVLAVRKALEQRQKHQISSG